MIGRVETQLQQQGHGPGADRQGQGAPAPSKGFDPVLGARPLRRTIQREIEDPLSEKILFEEVGAGQIVMVDVDNWGR